MYAPATRTITRRNIKATESAMRGLNGLGQIPLPIGNVDAGFKALFDWITGKTGEYKEEATRFAENAVKIFYGLEPDCSMPPPGIPIVPGTNENRFCSASVAGLIERCQLTNARNLLEQTKNQFTSRMNVANDPVAPFIKNWWNQYGQNDYSGLTLKISSATGSCGLVGQVPPICGTGMTFNTTLMKCIPTGDGGGGGGGLNLSNMSGPIMIMAIAGIAMLIISRR